MADLDIKQYRDHLILCVKIVPVAGKTEIVGEMNGMLKIKVTAPPEKQKANKCLIDFLAHILNIKKNTISIITGHKSPVKRLKISGLKQQDLISTIADHCKQFN